MRITETKQEDLSSFVGWQSAAGSAAVRRVCGTETLHALAPPHPIPRSLLYSPSTTTTNHLASVPHPGLLILLPFVLLFFLFLSLFLLFSFSLPSYFSSFPSHCPPISPFFSTPLPTSVPLPSSFPSSSAAVSFTPPSCRSGCLETFFVHPLLTFLHSFLLLCSPSNRLPRTGLLMGCSRKPSSVILLPLHFRFPFSHSPTFLFLSPSLFCPSSSLPFQSKKSSPPS